MKRIAATAALAALIGAPALGQSFTGAEFSLSGGHHFARGAGSSAETGAAAAQAQVGFGAGLFLQLDGALETVHAGGGGFSGTETVAAFGAHLGYETAPDTALGLYGGYEVWADVAESYAFGAEAAFDAGPVALEGHVGYRRAVGIPVTGREIGLDAAFPLGDDFSLTAGAGAFRIPGLGTLVQGSAGLSYDLADGLSLGAGYAQTRAWSGGPAAHGIGLTLTRTIDGGTTFAGRDLVSTLHGW